MRRVLIPSAGGYEKLVLVDEPRRRSTSTGCRREERRRLTEGQTCVILESMKMEMPVEAPQGIPSTKGSL